MGKGSGSCFGFQVESPLAFQYVRDGGGEPLRVDISARRPSQSGTLLVEWLPRPGRDLHARLFRDRAIFRLWIRTGGWFTVDARRRTVTVPETADTVRREERLWGIPAALCMLYRGDIPIHAAAVELNGTALLLAGPARQGKTTLAAAFLHQGFRPLSEDQSCIRIGSPPTVIPGPAMLRVRPDIFRHLRPAHTRITSESVDRISLALSAEMRGDCDPIRLGGIVLLRPSGDEMRVSRLEPTDALPDLWTLSFRLPGQDDSRRCFSNLTALVATVPVWNFHRPLRHDALSESVEYLLKHCNGGIM